MCLGGRDTFGRYECRAANSFGEARRRIEVGGLADSAVFLPADLSEAEPTGHTLAWSVRSFVPVTEFRLEYQGASETDWRSVNVLVEPQKAASAGEIYSGRVRLERLTPGTVYRARAVALNRYGWNSPPAQNHEFVTSGPKAASPRFEPSIDTSSASDAAAKGCPEVVRTALTILLIVLVVGL